MGKHALLSASSSKRWLSCTPSARLEEQFKDEPGGSVYAEEGTAAHALAEHKLKKALKRRSKRPVSDYHCDEMEECTDGYVAFAMEQVELARQECVDPVVLIEQRLDYSAYVPEGFGTGDLLIVADKVLTVIDLKYGKGVAVEAEWNPQMMLYGLGALELFDALYDIEMIRMTIYQPRLESVSTWEISVKDLMEWVEMELKPKAVLAIKGEGEFKSGDWCRFCRAKNTYRARAEEYLRLAQMEFKAPPLLSDEEIAEVLKVADELAKWSADVYAYAQDEAVTKGKKWAGFKLVEGRSNRKYTDEEDVAQCFQAIIEDREETKCERVVDGYAGFLFTDKNGYPEVAMHWEHRFNHMVKRYNDIYRVQMPNITPHVCRHTYCSNMAKSGMNPKTLQYRMGHSDIGVTLNTYTHLGLEDATDELRRMEELENARKELEKNREEKPVSQKMFRAI